MGRRSVKNLCLAYLLASGQAEQADLVIAQLKGAKNMTDIMGAMVALNHFPGEQRQTALTEFYNCYHTHPLVVNKWLALQASAQLPGTLNEVKKCLDHTAFSIHNPNNVYGLLVSFTQNMPCFHAADGSGYQFIADQVLVIDPNNAQVSARVVEPLTRWQHLDKGRQKLMRAQLQRIQATDGLSSDVSELVTKSLPKHTVFWERLKNKLFAQFA